MCRYATGPVLSSSLVRKLVFVGVPNINSKRFIEVHLAMNLLMMLQSLFEFGVPLNAPLRQNKIIRQVAFTLISRMGVLIISL